MQRGRPSAPLRVGALTAVALTGLTASSALVITPLTAIPAVRYPVRCCASGARYWKHQAPGRVDGSACAAGDVAFDHGQRSDRRGLDAGAPKLIPPGIVGLGETARAEWTGWIPCLLSHIRRAGASRKLGSCSFCSLASGSSRQNSRSSSSAGPGRSSLGSRSRSPVGCLSSPRTRVSSANSGPVGSATGTRGGHRSDTPWSVGTSRCPALFSANPSVPISV
jgi:hypothetical protein